MRIPYFTRTIVMLMSLVAMHPTAAQDRLGQIEQRLRQAPVQEKIYLHLDNNCYFKGDTIWYKAYVVRADRLTYTDMSRITYVELLSPDGMMVERQQLVTSPDGWSCGNFVLQDSIYSGYYELRAYTRWMLNFSVTQRDYNYYDRLAFYSKDLADDFFRDYGTLYRRVFPVYERPATPGEYADKYVVSRPKMRLDKELKEQLHVSFYPEGGHLIAGTRSQVAFEAYDEEGQQVEIEGRVGDMTIRTEHDGRGAFVVDVPEKGSLKARFSYHDKDYQFDLPDIEQQGCAISLSEEGSQVTARLTLKVENSQEYAAIVLCRGVMKAFRRIQPDGQGHCTVSFDKGELQTGVCDLIVVDDQGQPLADRLFFVNNHDYDATGGITVSGLKSDYKPLEHAAITLQAPSGTRRLSVAIRDGASDDPSYDTGNIMTDLLLSSELQGFVPHPDYYFESDDEQHRRHLDLLMMVQGWRRYDYSEITSTTTLRYQPEKTFTVEGCVYDYQGDEDFEELTSDNVHTMIIGGSDVLDTADTQDTQTDDTSDSGDDTFTDLIGGDTSSDLSGPYLRRRGRMKNEVTIKGELVLDNNVAEVEMQTHDGGRYEFNVPPYYGDAILFMMAYKTDISDASLQRYKDKGWRDEEAIANYYVKRDLFFPIFPQKYSYYQCHQPEDTAYDGDDLLPLTADTARISSMDRTLQNVNVRSRRRRSLHAVDYSKPAYVLDTEELYNLGIDYGLSRGYFQMRSLPQIVARLILGSITHYGPYQTFNVQARADGYIFYRDYESQSPIGNPFRSDKTIINSLRLKRQDKLRFYTDLEPRNPDTPRERNEGQADVYIDFQLLPDDQMRPTYRDRRIILHGFYAPDEFYHRDYSHQPDPAAVSDYRRTLYWNPNAQLDAEGRFTATFYNNNKPTRMRVSAAGLTPDGQPLYNP